MSEKGKVRRIGEKGEALLRKFREEGFEIKSTGRLSAVSSDGIAFVSVLHQAGGIGILMRKYRPEGSTLTKAQKAKLVFRPRSGYTTSGEWYFKTDSVSEALAASKRHLSDLKRRLELVKGAAVGG